MFISATRIFKHSHAPSRPRQLSTSLLPLRLAALALTLRGKKVVSILNIMTSTFGLISPIRLEIITGKNFFVSISGNALVGCGSKTRFEFIGARKYTLICCKL
ncbi:hypothetical protein BC629DRAFT_1726734 [Irpex lacteus]|nr:hypothetical protein BC629DRAFT_1726734 [Irpex lacteus]